MKVSKNTRDKNGFHHHMAIIEEGSTMLRITYNMGEFIITKIDIEGNDDAIKTTPLSANKIKLSKAKQMETPTNDLRWIRVEYQFRQPNKPICKIDQNGFNDDIAGDYVLQQRWVDQDGISKWREIEFIPET